MRFTKTKESDTGLNTEFNGNITRAQAIKMVKSGQAPDYSVVKNPNGPDFIRSKKGIPNLD